MNWPRTARRLVAVIGLGCAAAIGWYSRSRPPVPAPPAGLERIDPASALEGGEGQSITYRAGRAPITLSFKSTRRYDDGRGHFEGVRAEGLEESRFVIQADVAETSAPAEGAETPRRIDLSGAVILSTDDGLELRSETARWDDATGELRMPGPVAFTKGRLSGQGLGAVYDRARDTFTLVDDARAKVRSDSTERGGAEATATRMTLVRGQRTLQLEGDATIVGEAQTLTSRTATVAFAEDEQGIKFLELRGAARVIPHPGGAPDRQAMSADNITMSFQPDGATLQHATLTGQAVLELGGAARVVRAAWIDLFTGPDGRTVTRLQARDQVTVSLPATAEAPGRTITSAVLAAAGDEQRGLTSARFEGAPRFEETRTGGGQGSAGVSRTGTAAILVLSLGGQLDAIDRAEFQQNARFQDGDVTALADIAQYEERTGLLHLRPADPDARRPSHVTTADMSVDGATIDVDTATSDLQAQGRVTTRVKRAAAEGGAPGALFAGDDPIIGSADTLRFTKSSGLAVYTGAANAPAVLTQGQSSVQADRIEFTESSRRLAASGAVNSTWLVEPGAQAEAPAALQVYRVGAETLRYDETARTAAFAGPVVRMTTTDSELEAGRLTFRFAAGSRQLDGMRAEGAVWTALSGGYEAVGDVLVYDAAAQVYTLEGKAGHETARVKSPRTGAQGEPQAMCSLNDGMKLELNRRTGEVRIPGGGQAPRNVTEISCSTSLRRAK